MGSMEDSGWERVRETSTAAPDHWSEQQDADADQARVMVQAAFDPFHPLYRDQGPDRLLRAAQVYATLARG